MWNPGKSVNASLIFNRIMIVLVICAVVLLPVMVKGYVSYAAKNPYIIAPLLATLYACAVPGLIALFNLDRLLVNIRKKDVFIEKNVKYLRVISWCSFAVSAIFFVSGFYYLLFLVIAVAAAFFGLILRVVKNVIEQAVEIKNDNDLTI